MISYCFALLMDNAKSSKMRLSMLVMGLVLSLSMLVYYKYAVFILNSFSSSMSIVGIELDWTMEKLILPLGISFFTLQAVGYLFDVYRQHIPVERNIAKYAVFISFFPQLVAGPIERAKNILPQLVQPREYDYDEFKSGLKLIAWGLFKKVVVADNMATIVDPIYSNPQDYSGPLLLIGTIAFAFQIYCDFSGYTDMAIGLARTLGIRLMKNFERPYFAQTIPEFWRRWHISLSTWFRDYLYVPLGGNRSTASRWAVNIFIVFAVSGLWHGAQWTFVIWGVLHALYFLLTRWLAEPATALRETMGLRSDSWAIVAFQVTVTFSLVTFAWIFFRANSVDDAFYIINNILVGWPGFSLEALSSIIQRLNMTYVMISFSTAALLIVVEYIQQKDMGAEWFQRKPAAFRWVSYYTLAGLILVLGDFGRSKFIYFQF